MVAFVACAGFIDETVYHVYDHRSWGDTMQITNGHRYGTSMLLISVLGLLWSVSARAQDHPLGEPRADLERFYGVYGDGESARNFFVAPAEMPPGSERQLPDGYLMVGAMWGDVAPWYMKSLSDLRFEQQWVSSYQDAPLRVAFELGPDSSAVALTFETMFADRGRLQRIGDLPEGWQ